MIISSHSYFLLYSFVNFIHQSLRLIFFTFDIFYPLIFTYDILSFFRQGDLLMEDNSNFQQTNISINEKRKRGKLICV